MNWGFNGKFDGWYEIDAMSFHPYGDDEIWDFSQSSNSGNQMVIGCYPYEGYVIPGGGDEPEVMTGDVNGDNNVTIADVTALIDLLLAGDAIDNKAADVNGDQNVSIADVTALIDMLLSQN